MSGVPSWARAGIKVVCVDASNTGNAVWFDDAPVVGATYTIVRAWVDEVYDVAVVELAELHRSQEAVAFWREDVGYALRRFRPVVTIEDDISTHFSALLDVRAPQLEDAT